jgi:DNA-binding CsgD family transcriptional regulator
VLRQEFRSSVELVGRADELAALQKLVRAARSGKGAVAVLLGEPGIGKTRIAEELAWSLRAEGGTDLAWATCFEGDPTPFAPWVALASHVVSTTDPSELRRRLGPVASALPNVVPAVGEALPGLPDPAPLAPAESRFRVYDALARLVLPGPEEPPRLVVLDDLQWADTASLELLRYIARVLGEARCVVVGTARDSEVGLHHPLAHALAEVERAVSVRRVSLGPLDASATARLLESLLGRAADSETLESVRRESGGNPFFATELARQLDVDARPAPGVPRSVRDAVGRRIARLSPDVEHVLEVASAFSGPFEFSQLAALTGIGEEALLGAIDDALGAAMLRPTGGERYEFAHAIVRQTVYEAMSPSRRARLHRRVAQTLEHLQGGDEPYAGELAEQYHQSSSLPGSEHGLRHALTAADAARAAYAYERAAAFLRIARDLGPAGPPEIRAPILTRLAIAEADALLVDDARRTTDEAVGMLADSGAEDSVVAEFLAEAAWALADAGAPARIVEPLIERGVALLRERRTLTWARLKLAEQPLELFQVGGAVAGRWLGFDVDAVELARTSGGERNYARTVELMDWRTRDETDALRRRVSGWRDPSAAIHTLSVVIRSLMHQHGAFRAAGEVASELLDLADRHGSLPGRAYALLYVSWAALVRGDLAEARDRFAQADKVVERLGEGHRLRFSSRFLGYTIVEAADPDWSELAALRTAASRDPATMPWMVVLYHALAVRAQAMAGEDGDARRLLTDLVPALARLEPTTLNQNGAVAAAAEAAWVLEADEHARPLNALARGLVDAGVGDYPTLSTDLAVAWTAALAGDREQAFAGLDRARTVLTAADQIPRLAVVTETERVLRAGTRGAPPDGLTGRELEILRGVAAGRSNREIAADLVVSVHTVERHVANLYRKIGAHNRAEATAYAIRLAL